MPSSPSSDGGAGAIRVPAGALATTLRGWRETVLVVAALLALLEAGSLVAPPYILPGVGAIVQAGREILASHTRDIAVTLLRLLEGIVAAFLAGSLLGVAMGAAPALARYARPFLTIVMAVPALNWILFAILWFGSPELRVFFVIVVISLPFYALNVYEGIRGLPPDLVEAVEAFRPTRAQAIRLLVLPHTVPYIMMTTKSVLGYAIRITIFAELIGTAIGIGARLNAAQSQFRIDAVFAWTAILVVINFVLQAAVERVDRRLLRWRPEQALR
jgi:NitT/TauT family transport system permease protein